MILCLGIRSYNATIKSRMAKKNNYADLKIKNPSQNNYPTKHNRQFWKTDYTILSITYDKIWLESNLFDDNRVPLRAFNTRKRFFVSIKIKGHQQLW
jgi:hypothetical protein